MKANDLPGWGRLEEERVFVDAAKFAGIRDAGDYPWVHIQAHPEFQSFHPIFVECSCQRLKGLLVSSTTDNDDSVNLRPRDRWSWWGRCRKCKTFYYATKEKSIPLYEQGSDL